MIMLIDTSCQWQIFEFLAKQASPFDLLWQMIHHEAAFFTLRLIQKWPGAMPTANIHFITYPLVLSQFAIENGEIVNSPIEHGGSFHGFLTLLVSRG